MMLHTLDELVKAYPRTATWLIVVVCAFVVAVLL